jgi:DNA-binding transcriptional MerR regulator
MSDTTQVSMTIGQVAERTRLSVHTLRFYEQEGILVGSVPRDAGGRRMYGEDDVDWLHLCVILRSSGMPIPDIRRYAELVRRGPGTHEERLELMRGHRARVSEQIAELNRCLELIDFKVAVYEDIVERGADHGCEVAAASADGGLPGF